MILKQVHFSIGLFMFGFCTHIFASPASTDYVKAAVDTLRNEFHSIVNQLPIITPQLGEIYQGGIVFWVDASKQHGLVASIYDLTASQGISWRNGESGDRMVNAKGKGLGAGASNTRLIIAQQTIDDQQGQFAALLAENYEAQADGSPCTDSMSTGSLCYSGWYLPSIYELFLLQSQLNLSHGLYWSSTENSETEAWLLDFASKEARIEEKSVTALVRAIHAF